MITSPANERLKQARRVREGREPGQMFVEGERLIESCLASSVRLISCFYSSELTPRSRSIVEEVGRRGCPLFEMAEPVFATVSDTVNPQGVIVIAERPEYPALSALAGRADRAPLVVGLDAVQDPGNLGTIIRTAEAAGATGIVALRGSVDPYAPKTLRSAMGSAFRLPIVSDLTPAAVLKVCAELALLPVATCVEDALPYTDYDWRQPTLLILGNEGSGVSRELMEQCTRRVRIPLCAPVESLNVASAAAVILFEAARQRADGFKLSDRSTASSG